MESRSTSRREYWFVVAAGSALMLFTGAGAFWIKAHAERPQILLEVATGTKALPPPRAPDPNEAVDELLRSLPPDLALDVCANLVGGAGPSIPRPCIELREITAIAPAAPPSEPQSAVAVSAFDVPMPFIGPEPPADAATAPDAAMTRAAATSSQPEPMPAAVPDEPAVVSVQISEETEFDPAPSDIEVTPLAPPTKQMTPSTAVGNNTAEPRNADAVSRLGNGATAAAKAAAEAKAKAAAEAAKAKAKALAEAGKKAAIAATRGSKESDNGNANAGREGTSGEGGGD